jgi:FkbM family methyltransferase
MKELLKSILRSFLVKVPFQITQNQYYDYCTNLIIKQNLSVNSNCIDVGCHKGEVLDEILKAAPNGIHFGFEPIPYLYEDLKVKYNSKNINIQPYALGEKSGEQVKFNHVISNPAYSGLKKRTYDNPNEIDQEITVNVKSLDDCINDEVKVSLIKIDVEGGEYGVLSGASRILSTDKPLIIFEHGIGGSDHYGTTPSMIFDLLSSFGYAIYLLPDYIKSKNPIDKSNFKKQFNEQLNYYFVAH